MKKILALIIIVFMLSGCYWIKNEDGSFTPQTGDKDARQVMHSKEEILTVIDNLDCSKRENVINGVNNKITQLAITTTDRNSNCNLKNRYSVINEIATDKEREIIIKLNDYDLQISFVSSKQCTKLFSATCTQRSYIIWTNYQDRVVEYIGEQYYNQNSSNICNSKHILMNNYNYPFCKINNKEDISIASQYIDGFIKYINNIGLNINNSGKQNYYKYSILLKFPEPESYFIPAQTETSIGIKYSNGKYELSDGNGIIYNTANYIENYIKNNNVNIDM